ncbi:hypothetical protein AAG570_006271 [Ranatra chinensis]|uniref:Uncharacterized protein n=1 Tax=Ranatra chinensis TaxID=642074 RepID=A0ABD0YTT7_9HEMI
MASKRRNMFHKNKTQETTENETFPEERKMGPLTPKPIVRCRDTFETDKPRDETSTFFVIRLNFTVKVLCSLVRHNHKVERAGALKPCEWTTLIKGDMLVIPVFKARVPPTNLPMSNSVLFLAPLLILLPHRLQALTSALSHEGLLPTCQDEGDKDVYVDMRKHSPRLILPEDGSMVLICHRSELSGYIQIKASVPQGGVLGSLLHLEYTAHPRINDTNDRTG